MATAQSLSSVSRSAPEMLRAGIDHAALADKLASIKEGAESFLGYPVNLDVSCPELAPFLQCAINNVGDPFQATHMPLHTLDF